MTMNCAMAGWDKRTRELAKKKAIRRQQARDRGEETGSEDDDDDDDDDDEVATGVDWDVLVDKDLLTCAHPSMQGPFPFHMDGSESVRSAEPPAHPRGQREPESPPLRAGCRRRIGGWGR